MTRKMFKFQTILFIIQVILILESYSYIKHNSYTNSQIHHIQGRISGGFKAPIEQYPFLVSIRSLQIHKCGGAILKPNLIITSASCIYHENSNYLTIQAGSSTIEHHGQIIKVQDIIIHELYNEEFHQDCNIGLLTLKTSLLFSPNVQPISLQKHTPYPGLPTLISGWGVIVGNNGGYSLNLRAAGLRILTATECDRAFAGKGFSTTRLLCAAGEESDSNEIEYNEVIGPCNGDKGGPLLCTDEMALCGINWIWNYACGQASTERPISGYTQINHPDIINWLRRYI